MSEDVNVKANTEQATRIQLGVSGEPVMSEQEVKDIPPQLRTGKDSNTSIQFNQHGEAVQTTRPDASSYQIGQDDPAPTNILSTARHPQTGRPASEITGKTLVNVGGMETSIDAAVSAGYLRRTASGGYEEVGSDSLKTIAEAKAEAQAQEEALQAEHTIDLGHHSEFKADAEEALGEIEVGKMVNNVLMGKEISDETIRNHARKMHMEAEHFHKYMSDLIDTVQGKVDAWVMEYGDTDPADFYSWLRSNTPAHELSSRINYLVQTGDVRKALGEKLLSYTKGHGKVDPFQGNVEEVNYTRDGDALIKINGVQLTAADARKLGLID